MSTPSTIAAIKAAQDPDLMERFILAAAIAGVEDDPRAWVSANRERLAVAPLPEAGTIAAIYEYAVATYSPSPRPGENPAAVTDEHLLAAVRAVAGITSE